jgi:cytochrome bd ubiquinol oxidase subunit II
LPNLFWFLPVPILVLVTMYGHQGDRAQCPLHAVPADPAADLPGLQRFGHQLVAEHHPAVDFDLGGRSAAAKPGLYAGRHAVHHPVYLGYTFWSYYVFRGKVTHEDGYHC